MSTTASEMLAKMSEALKVASGIDNLIKELGHDSFWKLYLNDQIGDPPPHRLREHYRLERKWLICCAFYPEPGSVEFCMGKNKAAVFTCNRGVRRAEEQFALWLTTKRLQG